MLKSIRLEDWKSFGRGDDARNLVPIAPVTLLVGPNASGKSNVLDALRFFQGLARDLSPADIFGGYYEGQREVWSPIRGGVAEAARAGTSAFGLAAQWEVADRVIEHQVQLGLSPLDAFVGESFNDGRRVVTWMGSRRDLTPPRLSAKAAEEMAPFVPIWDQLRSIAFLDIQPSAMREYRPESSTHLGVAGENVSPVLASLPQDRLQVVVDWLSELCAPVVEGIDFDRTALREVMMFLVERGGARISARSASDGTLRFLGQLVALLTSEPGSILVIEEPDVGLHAPRIRILAELLQTARRRGVQLLATTHSPTLLSFLDRDTLADVVCFARDPDTGLSVCSRAGDLPHFDSLQSAPDVEHLISTGWLERAL